MIKENAKQQIIAIWDNYVAANQQVRDVRGNDLGDIDTDRKEAIKTLKGLIDNFLTGKTPLGIFKTEIDSFNKQNNLWGFTAVKGQMFFNQLTKYNDTGIDELAKLLKKVIDEPKNLSDALQKIDALENYCKRIYAKATDKRKAPNPKSVGYFLSYFWQIHNYEKWPVLFSSLTLAFSELGFWDEPATQKEGYGHFYALNDEVKKIISIHSRKNISNWDTEHAFWNYKKISSSGGPKPAKKKKEIVEVSEEEKTLFEANFELSDYIIPKVAKLIELGKSSEKSASTKGSEFEKLVAEIFKQLDFEVELLGQGTGRNPDVILKCREENTAFLVDAKAYAAGYSLGIDDRAIKEYINYFCPKLQKEGYKKIGFIIVSNSFKSNFEEFINEITWNTDIKRFLLLTSEALLYLLAYKTKDKTQLSEIVEAIVGFGSTITAQDIIEKFDDY
jgi:hypothetical protein